MGYPFTFSALRTLSYHEHIINYVLIRSFGTTFNPDYLRRTDSR